jgi:peptidyl-dipeptidase Dcp
MLKNMIILLTTGAIAAGASLIAAKADDSKFGPSNPFYAPSTLPLHAPPFDKIKDEDYQPAIEAGMDQEITEI